MTYKNAHFRHASRMRERERERAENATNTFIWVLFSVETAIKPHHLEQQLTINAHIHKKKSSLLKNLLSEYRV